MIDIDKLLPKSIYAMTVDELLELSKALYQFQQKVEARMKNMQASPPPPLGVSVADGIKSEDRFGQS